MGDNVNYYTSDDHPVPTLPVGKRNTRSISKQINKVSFQLSIQLCSLLRQSEWEGKTFFSGCKKEGNIVRLPSRALGCHKT